MFVTTKNKRGRPRKQSFGKKKLPGISLHSHAVAVSVNERLEGLVQRYPALQASLGQQQLENRKRIRDLPPMEQERILRMVFALRKASSG